MSENTHRKLHDTHRSLSQQVEQYLSNAEYFIQYLVNEYRVLYKIFSLIIQNII